MPSFYGQLAKIDCLELPNSLWPALQRIANSRPWPPERGEETNRFIEEAKLQFMLPLLFATADLPPALVDALAQHRAFERLSSGRAAIIEKELHRLIEVFGDEEIVLMKGADYGHRLYDSPTLRPMADIDILMPSGRMPAMCAHLEAAGYHRSYHGGATWRLKSAHEYVFTSETALIEVHQSFLQRSRMTIDYHAVWQRRVTMPGFPKNVFRLDDVDAIAYHALSMAIDEFEGRLIRDLDLWLLLRAAPASLERVAARAAEWSCRNALFGALTIAAEIFPDLRSDTFDRITASLLPARRRRFLVARVLPDPLSRRYHNKPSRVRQLWRKFWLMDSMARRAAFLLHSGYDTIAGRAVGARQLMRIARRTVRNASNAPSSTGQP
jgi:hypothetical protein